MDLIKFKNFQSDMLQLLPLKVEKNIGGPKWWTGVI